MTRREKRRALVFCWMLAAGVFATFTSESLAGALLPVIAHDMHASIGSATALIWGFAAGQIVGAWVIGMPLARYPPRLVLSGLLCGFAVVQLAGLTMPLEGAIALRFVAGATMTAYMATALGAAIRAWPGTGDARAVSIVFAGGTIGVTAGVPLATVLSGMFSWRGVFVADAVCAGAAAVAIFAFRMDAGPVTRISPLRMLEPLRNGRLWLTFLTSGLTLGAALMGFAFFSSILEKRTGFSTSSVSLVLVLYGLSSLAGNWVVGRLVRFGATQVVAIGLVVLIAGLASFWLAPQVAAVAIAAVCLVGISGVALNPAQTARNVEAGGAGPAVMAMAPTVATAGIFVATLIGGFAVDSRWGVSTPLLIGAVLAALALATLIPEAFRRSRDVFEPVRADGAHPVDHG